MRPDRACEIAADPLNADEGDVVAALTTLALAWRENERRRKADRAALIEAADLRIHRDDREARMAVAIEHYQREQRRVAELLDLLDELAPEQAQTRRVDWGVFRGPVFRGP